MPPWGAVKGIGEFQHDPSLSEPEIEMLIAWVEGGAPEGEPVYLIPPPAAGKPEQLQKFAREIKVSNTWIAAAPVHIAAVLPTSPAEIWITRRDGAIERLLWVKTYSKLSPRQYVFRTAIAIRPGDQIHVTAPVALAVR